MQRDSSRRNTSYEIGSPRDFEDHRKPRGPPRASDDHRRPPRASEGLRGPPRTSERLRGPPKTSEGRRRPPIPRSSEGLRGPPNLPSPSPLPSRFPQPRSHSSALLSTPFPSPPVLATPPNSSALLPTSLHPPILRPPESPALISTPLRSPPLIPLVSPSLLRTPLESSTLVSTPLDCSGYQNPIPRPHAGSRAPMHPHTHRPHTTLD